MKLTRLAVACAGTAIVFCASLTANASHSWNDYHWARTTSSFTLQTLDSTVSNGSNMNWPSLLRTAASQWSQSNKLDLAVSPYANSSRDRRKCAAVAGKIRVCNMTYGNNGWLGLASINLDSRRHITRGVAKMNDSYAWYYNSDPNEAPHVMCQEVGHLFGLGHTSEDGSSQQTCMDYSSDPRSTSPNSHDYAQLDSIYGHTDSYNSYSLSASLSSEQKAMAGNVPMGVRVHKGIFEETWVAPDGHGGLWIHHVTLAPGFEHDELVH